MARAFMGVQRPRRELERQASEIEIARREELRREIREAKVIGLEAPRRCLAVQDGAFVLESQDEIVVRARSLSTLNDRMNEWSPEDATVVRGLASNPAIDQVELLHGLGNHRVEEELVEELPSALERILRNHAESAGLFRPQPVYRGKHGNSDPRSWLNKLGDGGASLSDVFAKGTNGTAWEVLGTAALISGVCDGLKIYDNDSLAFGAKHQSRYPRCDGDGKVIGEGIRRRTVESDVLITRPDRIFGDLCIGVDFKMTTQDFYKPGNGGSAQLAGVEAVLQSGEVHQYHFVTNGRFEQSFKDAVASINMRLAADERRPIYDGDPSVPSDPPLPEALRKSPTNVPVRVICHEGVRWNRDGRF